MPYHEVVYDVESYPNWFFARFMHARTGQCWEFEESDLRHELPQLVAFLRQLRSAGPDARGVTFNGDGYDYPMLHFVAQCGGVGLTAALINQRNDQIIHSQDGPGRWGLRPKPWEVWFPQCDLMRLHHLDNRAKRTGLKQVEFVRRARSVEDLPFPPGTTLTPDQVVEGRAYNMNDVLETLGFFWDPWTQAALRMRDELSARLGVDMSSYSDKKIGTHIVVSQLEADSPGCCYDTSSGRREPRQTCRDRIRVGDVVLPVVDLKHPELRRVASWMRAQEVSGEDLRGAFKAEHTTASVGGFALTLGAGGVHGSVLSRSVRADAEHCVLDLDVPGFYPSLEHLYGLRPAHLGPAFTRTVGHVIEQRRLHPKGSSDNQAYKLAANAGLFGDAGSPFSPLYDPQFLLSVTVNGQLLLCMLVEAVAAVPGVELLQVNTDGLTCRCARWALPMVRDVAAWWKAKTRLDLEEGFYSAMFLRDVNAYLAVGEDGKKVKRKGAFAWVHGPNLSAGELGWHQDHSALVVPMAAEALLLRGEEPAAFVAGHADPFDFMLLAKAGSGARLEVGGERQQKHTRYYVSTAGAPMVKVMPAAGTVGHFKQSPKADWNGISAHLRASEERGVAPNTWWDERVHTKNRSVHEERSVSIESGYGVRVCNRAGDFRFADLDRAYYADKARALAASAGWTA